MKEGENLYDNRSKCYDEPFDNFYFKVYDAVTWKCLEPHVPTDLNAY